MATNETVLVNVSGIQDDRPISEFFDNTTYRGADYTAPEIEEGSPDSDGEFGMVRYIIGLMYQYFDSGIFVELALWYALYTVYIAGFTIIIYFTNLHEFVLGSDFAITVSFEFVQWTIVWVHHRSIELAEDRYKSGPYKLWSIFSAISELSQDYYAYLDKNKPIDDETMFIFVVQPFNFMKFIAIHTYRLFIPAADRLKYTLDPRVLARIVSWRVEDHDSIDYIKWSIVNISSIISDVGYKELMDVQERQSLNERIRLLRNMVDEAYQGMHVRSPDIYENFFMFAMIIYLMIFFPLTTYRNCQQFTPIIAPVIAGIVFGPFVINKVLNGPFAKNTIYKGNDFIGWRQRAINDVMFHERTAYETYKSAKNQEGLSHYQVFDKMLNSTNRKTYLYRRVEAAISSKKKA